MTYTPIPERDPEFTIKCSECDGLAFLENDATVTLASCNNIFTYTYMCLNKHETEIKIKEKQ